MKTSNISIVIPAKNESESLESLLPELLIQCPEADIILVDDGSTDDTVVCGEKHGVRVVSHPYSLGNGAAIKTGVRHAKYDVVVFMDADGQHSPKDIHRLLEQYYKGYSMVVGARDRKSQASLWRWLANSFYCRFASWMTGRKVADLTSGFRIVNRQKFMEFIYLLPNGFSYPTTSTMSFFRAGYSISYVPVSVSRRLGKSHIKLVNDGVRFLLIIFKIGTLYSPLKVFFPTSLIMFSLGVMYYLYTFVTMGRFTNMSALFFTTSIIIFMMGLIAEQITSLMYVATEKNNRD